MQFSKTAVSLTSRPCHTCAQAGRALSYALAYMIANRERKLIPFLPLSCNLCGRNAKFSVCYRRLAMLEMKAGEELISVPSWCFIIALLSDALCYRQSCMLGVKAGGGK